MRGSIQEFGFVLGLALALGALLGCDQLPEGASLEPALAPSSVVYRPPPPPDLCGHEIEALLQEPGLAGTPELDEVRPELLARARSVPVVFERAPEVLPSVSARVRKLREELKSEEDPAHSIMEVLRKTRGNFEERRAIFLTEDYLYAENVMLGLRLSQVLRLDHLFDESDGNLIIERGSETIELQRSDGRYFLPPLPDDEASGRKHAPRLASLLLFDRVRTQKAEFGPRLQLDFRPLQKVLGFSTAKVLHRTEKAWVVELSTYGVASRAIFENQDGQAVLTCESVQDKDIDNLIQARSNHHQDRALVDPILAAAHQMIERSLPFDEPKTEEGQQDGLLRIHFRKAYKSYQSTYEFNGDSYYVFDGYGRPRLPQVCIDFITDAFDWGTGGHWPVRGEKRMYQKGALNFASMGMENPRSVENLAEYASETPEWFDMLWLKKSEQVKFRHRAEFFRALLQEQDRYRRGDVVFIYGLKDDGKFHYHSFLIDEKDPVTGMPIVVVANAGPPQARSWEGEMQNAPARAIVARLRVRREILAQAHEQAKASPGVPLEPPRKKDVDVEVPPEADDAPPVMVEDPPTSRTLSSIPVAASSGPSSNPASIQSADGTDAPPGRAAGERRQGPPKVPEPSISAEPAPELGGPG